MEGLTQENIDILQRKIRRCSICRTIGHNCITCPQRPTRDEVIKGFEDRVSEMNAVVEQLRTNYQDLMVDCRNMVEQNNILQHRLNNVSRKHPPSARIQKILYDDRLIGGEAGELDCCICLKNLDMYEDQSGAEEGMVLSVDYVYCKSCYEDERVDKCAVCRSVDM